MCDVEQDPHYSIVEYTSENSGYRCGYCKSSDSNYSHGMWAHQMSVSDYQALINRGWRRSGKYCYKPTMNKTCCPNYTIKCDALNFQISKSQKKVLKRMHNFLSYGTSIKEVSDDKTMQGEASSKEEREFSQFQPKQKIVSELSWQQVHNKLADDKQCESMEVVKTSVPSTKSELSCNKESTKDNTNKDEDSSRVQSYRPGTGPDPSRPPCKKAKFLRREKRESKLSSSKNLHHAPCPKNVPKTLEDLLNEPLPENPAHRLELRLVRGSEVNGNFQKTYKDSYRVFRDYQMTIHKEPEDECEESSFNAFLVDSPLVFKPSTRSLVCGYGSYHQQYWLDDELIAVGVIDILPNCVSSVYLYYDPKYSFLSLGTYSSLREVSLVKELNRSAKNLKWYYMGYYIHSCAKMRYKGKVSPSFLLCPETYTWVPIEKCIPKLDVSKYSKLNSDIETSSDDVVDYSKVLCLYKGKPMTYENICCLKVRKEGKLSIDDDIAEYYRLVGPSLAISMMLYRN